MISRRQGDDTFDAFQPMGILRFWRSGKFTFFFKVAYSHSILLGPIPFPVKSSVLRWRPVFWRIPSARSTIEQKYEKTEGCEQPSAIETYSNGHLTHHCLFYYFAHRCMRWRANLRA